METPEGYTRHEQEEEHTQHIDTYCFYKRIDSQYKCKCNEKNVSIYRHYLNYNNQEVAHESMRMGIRAKTYNGLWIDTSFYSMKPEDYSEDIENQLIASWEILNKG